MKKLFNKIKATVKSIIFSVKRGTERAMIRVSTFHRRAVYGNAGEGYIDTAVKVLIAVVLGALVLAGLYAILDDTVMPTVTKRIQDMFNYAG